jgi:hypothetical protein
MTSMWRFMAGPVRPAGGLGLAAHGQAQCEQAGQKVNTRQGKFLSEKDTPAGCGAAWQLAA